MSEFAEKAKAFCPRCGYRLAGTEHQRRCGKQREPVERDRGWERLNGFPDDTEEPRRPQ